MKIPEGRVVVTPHGRTPYKVVFETGLGHVTEHPVSTVREGEALIRSYLTTVPIFPDLRRWKPQPLRLVGQDEAEQDQRGRFSR